MKYDSRIHHRRSMRLEGYDYSQPGAYFVTVVTNDRECVFGKIENGQMKLNMFGDIAMQEWERTAIVRPNVELGAYIVMPNHLHAIIVFIDNGAHTVGATRRVAPTMQTLISGSLGAIMAQFKSAVTKRINIIRGTPKSHLWQRNYYEHIIRNAGEANRIHLYIESNPVNWAEDEENR